MSDNETKANQDEVIDPEMSFDSDGRALYLDVGFYSVEVKGDPKDDFDSMMQRMQEMCNLANQQVQDLDERISDGDTKQYR